jgi:glycine oxidase
VGVAQRGYDVAVIGGGVVGFCCAWRTAQRGLRVLLLDPAPGSGASGVAAGMLAPVTELHHGEEELLRLSLDAARRYPDFVADVAQASGVDPGFRPCGTLAVALDAGDRAVLDDLHDVRRRLGLTVERLTGRECRRLEPFLAPQVTGGLHVAGDHQVDSRRLLTALRAAAERAGVHVVAQSAAVQVAGDRATGVRLPDGTTVPAGQVLLAAGCHSAGVDGVPDHARPPVRPVKGQVLRLRVPEAVRPLLSRTVRGTVRGFDVYLVPREDGEIVVGATVEELGFDQTVTAGGVYELLRDAMALVPGVAEVALVETSARLRPGSPDNAPILGPTRLPGLAVATGHHRNGILLAGVTGDAVAELLATGSVPAALESFSPQRFAASPSAASPTDTTPTDLVQQGFVQQGGRR